MIEQGVVRTKHSHYYKDVRTLEFIDVYRVLALFNVTDPCIQHAVKKLLVAGGRGAGKDITRDVQEAIDTMARWQEMNTEGMRVAGTIEHTLDLPDTIRVDQFTIVDGPIEAGVAPAKFSCEQNMKPDASEHDVVQEPELVTEQPYRVKFKAKANNLAIMEKGECDVDAYDPLQALTMAKAWARKQYAIDPANYIWESQLR